MLFTKIDSDNSNTLEYHEIKNFLEAAIDTQDIDNLIKNTFGVKTKYEKEDFKQIFIKLARDLCLEK